MTTLTDSGQGMDVAIGGLGFKLALNKEQPYERATAQFRKEQFDSAPNVGDQSLTGWWTRGQLSFHKGAGTKFYEVLEDDSVADSYAHGEGVNVSVPGRVTPYPDLLGVSTEQFRVFADATLGRTDICVGVNPTNIARKVDSAGTGAGLTTVGGPAYWCTHHRKDNKTYFLTDGGIERLDSGSDTLVARRTFGATYDPARMWSAKDRVFVVSTSGTWWAVDPDSAGTLDTADAFWPSGLTATSDFAFLAANWSLTDSPGAAYAAHGNKVYKFTVDATGVVPAMTAGIVVAQLPVGEYIYDIAYGLGVVVLATSEGVRVALIDDTDGLVVGPLSPALNEATSVDVAGNFAYVGGMGSPEGGAVALIAVLDLTRLISGQSVEFAHTYYHRGTSGGGRVQLEALRGGVYAGVSTTWNDLSANNLRQVTNQGVPTYANDKYVITAFHRFGTLESKYYHSLRVRTDPSPLTGQVVATNVDMAATGTIDVYSVKLDGTETLLGQVDATTSGADLTIGVAAEALAFKFSFNGTPYLLGYQLKALPSPTRQRMMRLPLMCFDTESRGGTPATGYGPGSAYARLTALEAMEAAGTVHDYQDFRTGETGTVFIESIEHRGTTPPGPQGDGYGGIVWVTMRKIA